MKELYITSKRPPLVAFPFQNGPNKSNAEGKAEKGGTYVRHASLTGVNEEERRKRARRGGEVAWVIINSASGTDGSRGVAFTNIKN